MQGSPHLFSQPEYVQYRDHARTLDGLAAYAEARLTVSAAAATEAGAPAAGQFVSCNYFQVLRARQAAGRGFARGAPRSREWPRCCTRTSRITPTLCTPMTPGRC